MAITCADKLRALFESTNRPYSATELQTHVQTEHKKAAVTAAIKELVDSNVVREKLFGKSTKIYFLDQSKLAQVDTEEAKKLDEQLTSLEQEHRDLGIFLKTKEALHSTMTGGLSVGDLDAEIARVRAELDAAVKQLEQAQADNEQQQQQQASLTGDADEHEGSSSLSVDDQFKLLKRESQKRKRIAKEIVDELLECYEGKKAKLLEEIGIDEEMGSMEF